jgi:TonB-dependent receptor
MPLRVPAAASALALVLALCGAPAQAQGQPAAKATGRTQQPADPPAKPRKPDQNPDVLQEVVVTGLRQSLMSAEAIKRLSPQIVDAVSAEDIGALPDRSVAEALERIPGVMIERTDNNRDPARLTDAGGNVFIRGLSWVKSELDGEDIFSANDGREISFEDISPDLLSAIEVYKSPTADQIEGGIGGVVDMETRKPLDSRHNLTAFSADYDYGDMIKKAYPTVNGLWSNYWETGIGKMGVLLSGTYAREGNRTDSIQTGDYVAQTLPQAEGGQPAGATVYVPNSMGWRRLDWQQNRQALDGVFQWQSPDDQWLLTAHAFQTKDDPINLEHSEGSYGEYLGAPGTTPAAGCSGYCSSADYTTVNSAGIVTAGNVWFTPQLDTRFEKDHHSTNDFTLNLRYSPTDRLTLSADVQYVESHADMVSLTAYTQVGTLPSGAPLGGASGGQFINFNLAGNNPTMVMSQTPYEMTTPSDYWWCCAMDHIEDNDAHQWAERLDGTLKFDNNPWLTAFRFGTRFQDRHAITRESNWNWSLLSWDYNFGGTPVPITDTPGFATELEPFSNFMRGSVPFPGVGIFPSYQLVRNGTAYAYSILKSTESAGWGWTPVTNDWSNYTPASGDNPINGINDQAEHTYAAYGEVDFRHDHTPIGPMDGNIGLRVVRTVNAPSTGIISISSIQAGGGCAAPTYTAAQCQFYDNAVAFTGGGGTFPYDFPSNSYTNALPSFNVRFGLTNDLQWRIAASQSMTQPTFSEMVPFGTVGFNFQGSTPLPAQPYPTSGTFGNPELKPILANNYDTSLEWYFGPSAELTFDVFYKQIRNYIYTANGGTGQSPTITLTHNGVSETFDVVKSVNGGYGTLRGAELQYQQFYRFLPGPLQGLGLQGNITFVDNSGGANNAQNVFDTNQVHGAANGQLPMEGMSRWSYNLALMYQNHGFEGRVAWNWRERYLLTTSAANLNEPVWMDNYGQLDGELFYSVTDYMKVGVQATNLLQARTQLEVGPGPTTPVIGPYSWTDTDRTVALAVRLQF